MSAEGKRGALWCKLTKKKVVMGPTNLDIIVKCDPDEPRNKWIDLLFTDDIGNAAEVVMDDKDLRKIVVKLDSIIEELDRIH